MTDAQTILKLIETVDPADSTKMDDIDARVWCYLNGKDYLRHRTSFIKSLTIVYNDHLCDGKWNYDDINFRYTRSRDALKAIRPEGWYFEGGSGYARMIGPHADKSPYERPELWGSGKSEELAELHAIIQTIAYERGTQ